MIELLKEEDLDQVLEIESDSFANPWSKKNFLSEIANNDLSEIYVDIVDGKVVAYGKTRLEALRIMRRALEEMIIDGIRTNTIFMCLILYDTDFTRGRYDTSFLEEKLSRFVNWDKIFDEIG